MNNAVYVSEEGIAEASASLLSCASELSELFDNINSVTTSIGSNVSGFTEIETVVDGLKQINSAKEALVDKINEFANYLTENVNPGYNAFQQLFAGLLGSIGPLSETLGNLFGFGSLGGNGYKDNGEGNNEKEENDWVPNYTESCPVTEGNGYSNHQQSPDKPSDEDESSDANADAEEDWKTLATHRLDAEVAYNKATEARKKAYENYCKNPTKENREAYNDALIAENDALQDFNKLKNT